MCNHPLVCLSGPMDRRSEKGARRKGTTGGSEDVPLTCMDLVGVMEGPDWHTWECFTMLPPPNWYSSPWLAVVPLVLWMLPKKSKSHGCLWTMFSSIPLWASRAHLFFQCPTALFLNGPRMLVWGGTRDTSHCQSSAGWSSSSRGTSREEFLVLPAVWSIFQRKATQGCWCDWAGWEHGCWAGLSQRCGKCCSHTLLCLIYIRIDKGRRLLSSVHQSDKVY